MTHCVPLSAITLKPGSHKTREEGVCLTEAVAWFAGESHSDHPACACPVLAAFARRLNDATWPSNAARTNALRPLIPLLAGSRATPEIEERRRWFLVDRATREFAPMRMEARAVMRDAWWQPEIAKRLREHAAMFRALPEIVDGATAQAVIDLRKRLWKEAYEAREKCRAADAAFATFATFAADAAEAAAEAAYAAEAAAFAAADADATFAAATATDAATDAADARLAVLKRAAEVLADAAQRVFAFAAKETP